MYIKIFNFIFIYFYFFLFWNVYFFGEFFFNKKKFLFQLVSAMLFYLYRFNFDVNAFLYFGALTNLEYKFKIRAWDVKTINAFDLGSIELLPVQINFRYNFRVERVLSISFGLWLTDRSRLFLYYLLNGYIVFFFKYLLKNFNKFHFLNFFFLKFLRVSGRKFNCFFLPSISFIFKELDEEYLLERRKFNYNSYYNAKLLNFEINTDLKLRFIYQHNYFRCINYYHYYLDYFFNFDFLNKKPFKIKIKIKKGPFMKDIPYTFFKPSSLVKIIGKRAFRIKSPIRVSHILGEEKIKVLCKFRTFRNYLRLGYPILFVNKDFRYRRILGMSYHGIVADPEYKFLKPLSDILWWTQDITKKGCFGGYKDTFFAPDLDWNEIFLFLSRALKFIRLSSIDTSLLKFVKLFGMNLSKRIIVFKVIRHIAGTVLERVMVSKLCIKFIPFCISLKDSIFDLKFFIFLKNFIVSYFGIFNISEFSDYSFSSKKNFDIVFEKGENFISEYSSSNKKLVNMETPCNFFNKYISFENKLISEDSSPYLINLLNIYFLSILKKNSISDILKNNYDMANHISKDFFLNLIFNYHKFLNFFKKFKYSGKLFFIRKGITIFESYFFFCKIYSVYFNISSIGLNNNLLFTKQWNFIFSDFVLSILLENKVLFGSFLETYSFLAQINLKVFLESTARSVVYRGNFFRNPILNNSQFRFLNFFNKICNFDILDLFLGGSISLKNFPFFVNHGFYKKRFFNVYGNKGFDFDIQFVNKFFVERKRFPRNFYYDFFDVFFKKKHLVPSVFNRITLLVPSLLPLEFSNILTDSFGNRKDFLKNFFFRNIFKNSKSYNIIFSTLFLFLTFTI